MSRLTGIAILLATLAPVPGSYFTLMATLQATGIHDLRQFFSQAKAHSLITHGANIDLPTWAFLLMGLLIWCVGLYVFYLIHISQNTRISSKEKQAWYLTLVLGHLVMPLNLIAMTRYWYKSIWRPSPQGDLRVIEDATSTKQT
ncbi:MAG: hypothetical protein IT209_09140 [Armatimonadetes bacterium]|nr:hypothetical protein [Armatimonadota bacterium]